MFIFRSFTVSPVTIRQIFVKLLALIFFPLISFAQIKLDEKITLLDQKVEITVPSELTTMTNEMWKLKYRNAERPILALSDKNVEVNLIGQFTNQQWDEKSLQDYVYFRIANLKKTRTDTEILENGVKDVAGRKVGYFKFTSEAIGSKIFNYYFFTLVDGKIFFFAFNCIEKLRGTWEKTTDEMVASLRTK